MYKRRALTALLAVSVLAVGNLSVVHMAHAEGVKIGFSMVTQQSPFYVQLKNAAKAAAAKAGDQLIFIDANGDISKQNNDIQDLITQKIQVLIIDPVDPSGVAPSLAAAKAANIPVITVDRNVHGKVISYIGRNNAEMGQLVGQSVVAWLGKNAKPGAKIIEIQGAAGDTVMKARRDGFNGAIAGSGYKIIEGPYCDYTRAKAATAMQDLLQAHPDVAVVYAHNDDMAMGALQVLHDAGRDDVAVAGIDGLSQALDAMTSSKYIATALNDPQYLGQLAVEVAIKVQAGQKVPALIDAGTELVTPANVAKIPHSGPFAQYTPPVLSN